MAKTQPVTLITAIIAVKGVKTKEEVDQIVDQIKKTCVRPDSAISIWPDEFETREMEVT